MRTVTLGVSSIEETQRQMAAAFGGENLGAFISFATVELLWKVLTAKRWDILQAMTGQGEMTIREIARRVGRDVKAVHGDVQALVIAGVLDRAVSGRVIFPYDTVHVDFTLCARRLDRSPENGPEPATKPRPFGRGFYLRSAGDQSRALSLSFCA